MREYLDDLFVISVSAERAKREFQKAKTGIPTHYLARSMAGLAAVAIDG